MIKRFYVHNFRSLQNFELPAIGDSSALLIGRNGAGKSSVGMALEILQRIGRGQNRIRDLIQPEDIVIVRYTVAEEILNTALSLLQFNFLTSLR